MAGATVKFGSTAATGVTVNSATSITATAPVGSSQFAYVTNFGAGTVSVISVATGSVVSTVTVGSEPTSIAITPNGAYAYVANYGSGTVSVISTATNTLITNVTVGSDPYGIAITPNGAFVYVTNSGTTTVSVISTAANTVSTTVPGLATGSDQIALTPNGAYAYVTNATNGNVYVITTSSNLVTTTIGGFNDSFGLAVTPNGSSVYVANSNSPTVSVISTSSNTIGTTISVPSDPYGVTVTPDGAHVYVSYFSNSNNLSVISTASNTATTITGTFKSLLAASTSDDADVVLTDYASSTVSIVATASNTVAYNVSTAYPFGVAVAVVPQYVTVTTSNGTSATGSVSQYTYAPTTVSALSPSTGPSTGGTSVSITGTGFTSGSTVKFGPTAASSVTVNSATSITAVSPAESAEYAYVSNDGAGTVSVVSLASGTVVSTIPVGTNPLGIAVTPNGAFAYVANSGSSSVSVISTATNTVVTTVPVGSTPYGIAITPNGAFAYVANSGANTVSVISTASNTVAATISGLGSEPEQIAITPNGSTAYVANTGGTTVSVINTSSNIVTTALSGFSSPWGMAITPNGADLYVGNVGAKTVSVISTSSNTLLTSVSVPNYAFGLSATPNGASVYVSYFTYSSTLSVISTATNSVTTTISGSLDPFEGASTLDDADVVFANFYYNNLIVVSTATNTLTTVGVGSDPFGVAVAVVPQSVTVTTPAGTSPTSASSTFSYEPAPIVDAVSPGAAPVSGGTTVTITGTGFVSGSTVGFGSAVPTSMSVQSSTTITAVTPFSAVGSPNVTVTTSGGTSNAYPFAFDQLPVVNSLSVLSGATSGGTTLTINGYGLSSATSVKFGSVAGTNVSYSSTGSTAGTLSVTSPAESAGVVDVTVVSPGGTSATSQNDQYIYGAPTVTSMSSPGDTNETTVSVTGTGFASDATVSFGSLSSPDVTVDSPTSLTAVAPTSSSGGLVNVTVQTNAGTSATNSADQFAYGTNCGSIGPNNTNGITCNYSFGQGYVLTAKDGGAFTFGDAAYAGSLPALGVNSTSMVSSTPYLYNGQMGYCMLQANGWVYCFAPGNNDQLVNAGGAQFSMPCAAVAITPTQNDQGYWAVDACGDVYSGGSGANYFGGLNSNGLGLGATNVTGIVSYIGYNAQGYCIMTNSPQNNANTNMWTYCLGSNDWNPSTQTVTGLGVGGVQYTAPQGCNGLAMSNNNDFDGSLDEGYWILDSCGHVYTVGTAQYYGGVPTSEAHPTVSIGSTPDGAGYWVTGTDGGTEGLGDAYVLGAESGASLNQPVSGISAGI